MTRINWEGKALLIAVAALAMSAAGLMRGPTEEEVLAQAVREVVAGDATVIRLAPGAVVQANQGPRVTMPARVSSGSFHTKSRPKKGQPVTLGLTTVSTDATDRLRARAFKIDRDISPGTTTATPDAACRQRL
jgi:hypothetical protein